jgi:enoyl-CoA hydratase/carnithine racemase
LKELQVHQHGHVAEVLLARNAVNSIDPGLVDGLARTLGELADDRGIGAIVLGSAEEKFFSAGWDLPRLVELDRDTVTDFVAAFNRLTVELACLRVATVAAVDGYAVAGGFILALACDFRVMTSDPRRKVGLTEVDLGLPLPLPSVLLLRALVTGAVVRDVAVAGRLLGPEQALAAGLVDRLAEPGRVREAARELAAELGAKPGHAHGTMKALLHEDLVERVAAEGPEQERRFVDAFFHPETRVLLRRAAKKLTVR